MNKHMKRIVLALLTGTLIIGCISQNQRNENEELTQEDKKEYWKVNNYIDSVQILLTNEYQLDQSLGNGASSFLIKAKRDTLLCTAKHLLGEAMGINPEIKTDKFNSSLKYWKAYPRNGKISKDTISVTKLITEKQNDIDIILLDGQFGKENNIVALTPRFSKIREEEKLEIIGCEYTDWDCHQRKYVATMYSDLDGQILLKSEDKFSPSGFSGAPVIDSNGLVAGLLSGGGEYEGDLYLTIEPISKIATYLK